MSVKRMVVLYAAEYKLAAGTATFMPMLKRVVYWDYKVYKIQPSVDHMNMRPNYYFIVMKHLN